MRCILHLVRHIGEVEVVRFFSPDEEPPNSAFPTTVCCTIMLSIRQLARVCWRFRGCASLYSGDRIPDSNLNPDLDGAVAIQGTEPGQRGARHYAYKHGQGPRPFCEA
eukprot:m.106505 g.106505  ORF g.106505 m.106505 type:complete len:108 (-) comp12704_c0_seq6:1515-1838(-)